MKKILLVYSTWAGATHAVANKIGEILQENNFKVDIQKANIPVRVDEYDGFILGTSIHAGKTIKSFQKFIKTNLKTLIDKPTAVFVVCANMINDTEESRQETRGWLNNSIEKFKMFNPISIGLFGGAFLAEGTDFDNLNFFIRKMIVSMGKNLDENQKNIEFLNSDSIINWANELSKII